MPESGKRFRFEYVYDFGDDWRHEVLFEGYAPIAQATKFPLCIEGEKACPPEDIGGPWGYAEYREAIADPSHERHDEFIQWLGVFDVEAFSVDNATKAMRNGLPNS